MRRTHETNDEVTNARFLRTHLRRHGGDARLAAHAARDLAGMDVDGAAWWHFIAAECLVRYAAEMDAARYARGQARMAASASVVSEITPGPVGEGLAA